jgi:hypothetical protein
MGPLVESSRLGTGGSAGSADRVWRTLSSGTESGHHSSGRQREPKVGKLAIHRIISALAATTATLAIFATSAGASNTLLSGYGGPGEGNQAIIGSTLVGGGGGGQSGGGAASASTQTSATSPSSSSSPSSIALPTAKAHSRPSAHPRRSHAAKPSTGVAAKPAPHAYSTSPAADRTAGGGTLGLTGADVVYIILAFGALALTGLLTTRLTGRAGRAGRTQ